jgi:hypothetical protein
MTSATSIYCIHMLSCANHHVMTALLFNTVDTLLYNLQGDRHVALLTVKETLNFAFDSMEGGQHASWIPHHQRTAEQHELISWMDKRYSKVCDCSLVL